MFRFITHRPLWVNMLVGMLLALGAFFLLLYSLKYITGHGKAATVPMVKGKSLPEAQKILINAGFRPEVQDSVYVDSIKPHTVLKQFPEADEVVKANRIIYLIITRAVPPEIQMPNLIGYSFRSAEMILKNMGLKLGDTLFRPDFAKNSVLEQLYNGQPISPGSKIRKGSVISLVLGDGVGERQFVVPDIIGLTFCEAKEKLKEQGIIVGAIVADPGVTDTCNAYIYRQNPEQTDDENRLQYMRSGQTMDMWLQQNKVSKDSLRKAELKAMMEEQEAERKKKSPSVRDKDKKEKTNNSNH
ncbi:MAG: PASTA domain-containing protein [Chitinophagaceae bacterium]|nr:PASTA domain-containing protein [Chitinophagaceae bacterium]